MMKKTILLLALFFTSILSHATETTIIVRAKAKDAKFVGSSMGGAYVIIRDKTNGRILAEGKTVGSTGNTNLIMNTPVERGASITDEETAKFTAVIDIQEPVFVSIEVLSPFTNKQAQARVSTELWIIPGKDIVGDGIILEVPGFIIDILKPRTHQYISLSSIRDQAFEVQANIVMMCGCTINKGGTWDSEKMEVKAILKKNGSFLQNVEMALTETNLFNGSMEVTSAGEYELTVYAYDAQTGNTGVDKVNYIVFE